MSRAHFTDEDTEAAQRPLAGATEVMEPLRGEEARAAKVIWGESNVCGVYDGNALLVPCDLFLPLIETRR